MFRIITLNLIFMILIFFSTAAQAITEGYDIPSAEEVMQAELQVLEDFSRVENRLFSAKQDILKKYSHLDKTKIVPRELLRTALTYFDQNKRAFKNQKYISVVDLGRRSNLTRLFIINMSTGVVTALRTTHGYGSDVNQDGYAESFGNVSGSGKSSLGFYKVAEDYYGRFGHSIRLDGLSSTNSRARARAVVVHGYDGVYEKSVIQNLSAGCFGLSWGVRDWVVANLKGGSLLYAGTSTSK